MFWSYGHSAYEHMHGSSGVPPPHQHASMDVDEKALLSSPVVQTALAVVSCSIL